MSWIKDKLFNRKIEGESSIVEDVNNAIAEGKINVPAGGTKLYKHVVIANITGSVGDLNMTGGECIFYDNNSTPVNTDTWDRIVLGGCTMIASSSTIIFLNETFSFDDILLGIHVSGTSISLEQDTLGEFTVVSDVVTEL